ncbi:MAG: hypothetical protein JNM07_03660 [Phycisphaerae bacterium]|nr:hypothetical protein [Phycisphaerae bacterium]
MRTALTIPTPSDYLLTRDCCSYGYFLLEPNRWDPATSALRRVLDLDGRAVTLTLTQPRGVGTPLRAAVSRALSAAERAAALRQVARMLRLDEPHEDIRAFHRADRRWARSGRGRLFRSPTLFEDVIKTVTSCNVSWPSTIVMNRRLCEVYGARDGELAAFPSPQTMARQRPGAVRGRCRVGYRDARIVELARMFASGTIRAAWFEDPATADDDLHDALVELPGIGPYAAANIMQLLGRYSRLPLDSESVRHGRAVLGFTGSERRVMKRVAAHFEPFGAHRFRSYWFEMWRHYERLRGAAWTWERETTGATFTASQLPGGSRKLQRRKPST